ncbi:hypothetical protein [Pyrodictium occultum]|uniref:hypothetical protein n=1 Tax=Pyrodictium occultum TaxID=2309 RepID=UPI0014432931|nr:hypothetical protein [Pyrodictium occultum]
MCGTTEEAAMTEVLNTEKKRDDVEPTQGASFCAILKKHRGLYIGAFAELNDCKYVIAYTLGRLEGSDILVGCVFRVLMPLEPLSEDGPPRIILEGLLIAARPPSRAIDLLEERASITDILYVDRDSKIFIAIVENDSEPSKIIERSVARDVHAGSIGYMCVSSFSELRDKAFTVLPSRNAA